MSHKATEDLSFHICRIDAIVLISLDYLKRKVNNLYARHLEVGSESGEGFKPSKPSPQGRLTFHRRAASLKADNPRETRADEFGATS